MRKQRAVGNQGCGKFRFATWDEANIALLNAKIAQWKYPGGTRRRESRIYWCGLCESHHLSSKPDRYENPGIAS